MYGTHAWRKKDILILMGGWFYAYTVREGCKARRVRVAGPAGCIVTASFECRKHLRYTVAVTCLWDVRPIPIEWVWLSRFSVSQSGANRHDVAHAALIGVIESIYMRCTTVAWRWDSWKDIDVVSLTPRVDISSPLTTRTAYLALIKGHSFTWLIGKCHW